MARKGDIEIPVAVDTSGVEKSIQNGLIDPIEDAEKALKKLGDTDAGRDIDKAMDKAQDATEDLQDELEATRKDLDKLGYAARDAGDEGSKGMGRIKGATQEVSQEVGQNLGEAVSSIRGDLSDLGQVGQDTLGGLAATLAGAGPAGLLGAAALAAGAVGLGAVTAEIQNQQEQAEELKARLSDLYKEALESGRDYIDQSQFIAESNDLRFNPERADEWKRLQEDAKTLSLDQNTIIKANSGDLESQELVQRRINEAVTEQKERASELGLPATYSQSLNDLQNRWTLVNEETKKNRQNVTEAQATADTFWREVINNASSASEEVDEFGNKLYTLPDGRQVLISADTGLATDNVEGFKGDVDGIPREITTTVKVVRDSSAWDNWRPNPKTGVVMAQVPRSIDQER